MHAARDSKHRFRIPDLEGLLDWITPHQVRQ